MKREWYEMDKWRRVFTSPPEEVDPDSNIVATYLVTPRGGLDLLSAGINIAAEESIGTWTHVKTLKEHVYGLAARVFEMKGLEAGRGLVKVAYPLDLFDLDSGISHLLTIVAGNLFGLSALERVKLIDISLPKHYVKMYKGPKFGIEGVRKLLGTDEKPRPHLGTIIKPKVGLTPRETAEVAYEAAMGGVDFIKDDETLTNQKFNPIPERVTYVMEALDRVREETGRVILYAVNVTADLDRLWDHVDAALDHGANCLMIDVICAGFPALRALAEDPSVNVPIHVHRAMHAAMTRVPDHGIHMMVLAKLTRLAGGDQLHTGTARGKMEKPSGGPLSDYGGVRGVRLINDFLRSEWHGLKTVMPVASGGIHPALVPANLEALGSPDIQINAGGGIHGHPWGPRAGARAMRQAMDAYMKGIPLEEYAKDHPELAEALKYWGRKFM